MRSESPMQIDLQDPHAGSGTPEAITEQPDLGFERRAEARWLADVMGMRLMAVALVRRARRGRGEDVTPVPWFAIAVTVAITAATILAAWLVGTRLAV